MLNSTASTLVTGLNGNFHRLPTMAFQDEFVSNTPNLVYSYNKGACPRWAVDRDIRIKVCQKPILCILQKEVLMQGGWKQNVPNNSGNSAEMKNMVNTFSIIST